MALYNYLLYDRPELVRGDSQATVVINVGADSTDLVVCTKSGVWQRCIMMGGNAFTQAIAETFKLSPEKAEKLKRTAPVSKYARQIFQAMRPVFTEWAGEVQRSLGFYSNSNPDVKLTRIVALGGGTKLRGLLKYLGQTLQIPVEKPDVFKKVAVAQGLSAAKFHDSVADFGVVYGLGLQGLGLARIESNLLPSSVARSMAWASKTKYFIGAAVLFFFVSLMCLGRVGLERIGYAHNSDLRAKNQRVLKQAQNLVNQAQEDEARKQELLTQAEEKFGLFKYRETIPQIYNLIQSVLPNAENNPQQRDLYEAYARGDVDAVIKYDRSKRKQIFLVITSIYYSVDIEKAQFGETSYARKQAIVQEAKEDEEENERDRGRESRRPTSRERGMVKDVEEKNPGFVVTVLGYSPYADIQSLLHPTTVGDQPDKWGVVTRLRKLGDPDDPNCPLALLSATEGQDLRINIGIVDLEDGSLPAGIGAAVTVDAEEAAKLTGSSAVSKLDMLVDPLTREYISAVAQLKSDGTLVTDTMEKPILDIRDHWFELNFKLKWNAGPKQAEPTL